MAEIKYIGRNTDNLYNDGDQVEQDIYNYIKTNSSNDYWDIINQDNRWAVFYHLTDMRENILNWYDFKPDAEILEIGGGMGALTGLLCKKAKSVTTVELTNRRAETIIARHANCNNLTVLAGNFNDIKFDQQYDYITLIGVLEYAPGFTPDGKPATFLKRIRGLLKPNGKLLIAIENRFGLKYWCGAGEDHTGKAYDGINGYTDNPNIRTFSRAELTKLLTECGLNQHRFYYPLPDYKLPQVIYSDEYLPKKKILSRVRAYYLDNPSLLADEAKIYKDVVQNDAFPFMANSFFVECGYKQEDENHPIFALFSPDRKEEYRTITVIYSKNQVRKYAASPDAINHIKNVYEHQRFFLADGLEPYKLVMDHLEMPLIKERQTLSDILADCIRKGDTEQFRKWIELYYAQVKKSSELIDIGEETVLKHGFFDMTFSNCFVSGEQLVFFDQEWEAENVSPLYILFYAIRVLYGENPDLEEILPSQSLLRTYIGNEKKVEEYTRINMAFVEKVFTFTKNALSFLDSHKGVVDQKMVDKMLKTGGDFEMLTSFYFGDETGYNEERSHKIRTAIDSMLNIVTISQDVTVPAGCNTVRIDPCEGYLCTVNNIEIICNGQSLSAQPINGLLYCGIIVFPTEDPQFVVTLPHNNGSVLHVDFSVRLYSSRDSLLSKIPAKEQEMANKLATKEQEIVEANDAWESKLLAKEQEIVEANDAWESKLAAKEQEMVEANDAWESKLAAKEKEVAEANDAWESKLLAKEQEVAEANDAWESKLAAKEQEMAVQINSLQEENRQTLSMLETAKNEKQQIDARYAHLQQEFNQISGSACWKMTKPIRMVLDGTKAGIRKHKTINLALLSAKWRLKYNKEEVKKLKAEYIRWNYPQTNTNKRQKRIIASRNTSHENFFSILVPLYNTPDQFLRELIDSVQAQTCLDWELCLADASDSEHAYVEQVCREYAAVDDRIKFKKLRKNLMISGNTNEAAKMATGRYICLLDHDDLIAPTALEENKTAIQLYGSDILYSDEDHLLMDGTHGNPFFKPDWSPDLLYSQMYICHFLVFRRELFEGIGGFRSKYDGSQDYDLMLRLCEKTNKIYHIPKILYTWRESPSSTASNADSKPYAQFAGKDALDEHLKKIYGEKAHADESEYLFVYDARYPLPEDLSISIIIPMKDKWELTDACVKSIIEKSTWKNYEILILDNRSESNGTKRWFKKITGEYRNVRVIRADMEFNWSKLNNFGMRHAKGNVYIFLNNDTVVITPDWMERLAEKAVRKDTGVVGPLLLYEDNTIQHAGIVVGIGGWADHVFKGMQPVHYGAPFVSPMVTRNVTAVTGACMAVAKTTIEKIGNFDESFIICGSDVELGIRANQKGLFNVYDASVRLYHLESKSRDSFIPEIDFKRSYEVYTPYREGCDPYFNPNLDINSTSPKQRETAADIVKPTTIIDTNESKSASALTEVQGPAPVSDVGEVIPILPRTSISKKPRINLLIPSVDEKHVFGGIATALKIFQTLCDHLSWEQRIITTDASIDSKHMVLSNEYKVVKWKDDDSAEKQVVSFNDRAFATLPVRNNDVFVATGWWTAYTIQEVIKWQKETYFLKEARAMLYFVQDYEPGFYPWSSRYLMADSTYRMDIPVYAILNAGLLKEHFDKSGYQFTKAWCFEPTLNEKLKACLPTTYSATKKRQILVYGRPGTPRNAFELVCMSLREFIAINPEEYAKWIFLAAGESFADVDLGFGAVLRSVGKLTLQDYAKTMLETYAGISLMVSPHPSYPPLEMSTFGIKTITNTYNHKDLSTFNECIYSVSNCNAKSIANKLNDICKAYTSQVDWKVNEAYVKGNTEMQDVVKDVAVLTAKMVFN